MRRKRILVSCLFVANIFRCMSLAAEVLLQTHAYPWITQGLGKKEQLWLEDVIWLAPAMVFLSVFSIVVFYWASLHYTATITPAQLLDWAFICVNLACLVLLFTIVACTFFFQAYDQLWSYVICVLGLLNFVVGLSLCYYGIVLTRELANSARRTLPAESLISRTLLLSVVCPCGLFIRGCVYVAWDFSFGTPSFFIDLLLCGVSELVPSVIILGTLVQTSDTARDLIDKLEDSTETESPLLQDASPATPPWSFGPVAGNGWTQLYPRPDDD